MAIKKINYTDKIVDGGITDAGKFLSDNANEIKNVVNNNADELNLVKNWVEDKISGVLTDVNNEIDSKLQDLIDTINSIASDGTITPAEKLVISVEVNRIKLEYPQDIEQLDAYNFTTLKAQYIAVYNDLISYITPILLDVNNSTSIDSNEFSTKFTDYYAIKVKISKEISLSNKSYQEQADETLVEIQSITNFWKVTVGNSLLAAGTMLVGTTTQNNAGITGITEDGNNSVRFWAGSDYAGRKTAPFRVLDNGKFWFGSNQSGIDYGITRPDLITIRGGLIVDSGGNSTEAVVYRDDWNSTTIYFKNNTVTYKGGVWIYSRADATSGHEPEENSTYWSVYVAAPTDGTQYDNRYAVNGSPINPPYFDPNDLTNPNPVGWVTINDIPSFGTGEYLWKIVGKFNSEGDLVDAWSQPYRETGLATKGQSIYKALAFKRSDTPITVPPMGGDFNNPTPTESTGWYDNISTDAQSTVYMSTRIFTSDGLDPQEIEWSVPRIIGDTPDLDFEWSEVEINPGDPTSNPLDWINEPTVDVKWMALRKRVNGFWSGWTITRWGSGKDGTDGKDGRDGANGKDGLTIPGPPGADGKDGVSVPGPAGPMLIQTGKYNASTVYYGGNDMVNVVDYEGWKYRARTDLDPNTFSGKLPTNTLYWVPFENKLESLDVQFLTAVSSSVTNLEVGHLSTPGGRITMNKKVSDGVGDNMIRFNHENGSPGFEIGIIEGTLKMKYTNVSGDVVWELGSDGLVTTTSNNIPESWASVRMLSLGDFPAAPTNDNLNAMKTIIINHLCRDATSGAWGVVGNTQLWDYQAGWNPDAEVNRLMYGGLHTTQVKATDNWIPKGWYLEAGLVSTKMIPGGGVMVAERECTVTIKHHVKGVPGQRPGRPITITFNVNMNTPAGTCPVNFNA